MMGTIYSAYKFWRDEPFLEVLKIVLNQGNNERSSD